MSTADELVRALAEMAHRTEREAARLSAAVEANAVTVEHEWFALAVAGGRLHAVAFTPLGAAASHVQLRQALLAAYREARARATDALSEDVARLTGQADAADDASDQAAGDRAVAEFHAAQQRGREQARRGTVTASLEELFADEPDYLDELARRRGPVDWQREFRTAVADAVRDGRQEAGRRQGQGASAASTMFRVTATAPGELLDVTILPGARGREVAALSADLLGTYQQACARAAEGDGEDPSAVFTIRS